MKFGTFITIIIVIIALATILYVAGYLLKKVHFSKIDELERKKIDLMDIPVIDDINRVKQLNLTGQTLKTFESWAAAWQNISTVRFPDIENLLFEAEQATEKYKLGHARQTEDLATQLLDETEEDIEKITAALHKLIESEEDNRADIKGVKDSYQDIRKRLLTQGFSFGNALENLEKQLSYIEMSFSKFTELTEKGDHIEAREVLDQVRNDTSELKYLTDAIPDLLRELTVEFAEQVSEIKNGHQMLLDQSFVFDEQADIPGNIKNVEDEIAASLLLVEQCEMDLVEGNIKKIAGHIDTLYDVMQAELDAKQYVVSHKNAVGELLSSVNENNRKLLNEIDMVSQSYTLLNNEQEEANKMKNELETYTTTFEQLTRNMREDHLIYSLAESSLKEMNEKLVEMANKQGEIVEGLTSLRKDELAAKEALDEYEFEVRGVKRFVEKQHLPGLSKEYKELFFATGDRVSLLADKLNKVQINISEIKHLSKMCGEDIDHLKEKTEDMVDAALITEYMLQYANRYRHQYESIEHAVATAMTQFSKQYDYQQALETISVELEKVEPGAFIKVQEMYNNEKRR